jgi:RNA polymerase sigma-70 factor (ECF subfamily)
MVLSWIHLRSGKDRQVTEEIVQETWLVVARRIADFDPSRSAFETWVIGIARNILRNHLRRARREESTLALDHDPVNPRAPDPQRGSEIGERILLALTSLPGRFQDVLRDRYHEQLTVTEIATRRGQTPKAVESLLGRARKAFRRAFGEDSRH